MGEKITCYKEALEALTTCIYPPSSNRIIEFSNTDFGEIIRAKNPFISIFRDIYKKYGKKIELEKSKFDELYNKCAEEEKLKKETKDLAKKLTLNKTNSFQNKSF